MIQQNQNFFNLMKMTKQGNPEQIAMSMLQQYSSGNPVMQNLLVLAQKKDTKGIENVARNMAKERGIDFDSEFNEKMLEIVKATLALKKERLNK